MERLPPVLRVAWRRIASWPRRFRTLSLWWQLVLTASLVYTVVFSALTLAKFEALRTYAWDLGVYSQATYTTAYSGRLFYYTVDLPNNPGGSIFGAHFAPILFLAVPFLWLVASPGTLLVLQSAGLGAGGVFVFRVARLRLPERVAAFFSFAYLLSPALQGVNWYDFHPEAFFIPLALAVIYCWERRAWAWYALAVGLALSTLEFTGFIVAALGLFWLADSFRLRDVRGWMRRRETWVAAATCLVGIAWAFLGLSIVSAFNPGLASEPATVWGLLGATSGNQVPLKILTNPGGAAAALAYDAGPKLTYLALLFGPVLFLPFRRPLTLITVAPWLVLSLTSSGPTLYQIGDQFPSLVLGGLFYAAILGAERILSRRVAARPAPSTPMAHTPRSAGQEARPFLLAAAVVLAFAIAGSPAGPYRVGNFDPVGIPVFSDHVAAVRAVIALVPPGASILTQNNLFTFFATRVASYVVPTSSTFHAGATFNSTIDDYLNQVEYVLVDVKTGPTDAAAVLLRPGIAAAFGLFAWDDGAVLLRRAFTAPPVLDPVYRVTFAPSQLYPENVTSVPDATSLSGTVFYHPTGLGSEAWNGPAAVLPPGVYALTFRIRVDVPVASPVLTVAADVRPFALHVLSQGGGSVGNNVVVVPVQEPCELPLSTMSITGATSSYANYTLAFRADVFGLYTFPGFGATSTTGVYLDRITAVSQTPLGALRAAACP